MSKAKDPEKSNLRKARAAEREVLRPARQARAERRVAEDDAAKAAREGSAVQPLHFEVEAALERGQNWLNRKREALSAKIDARRASEFISYEEYWALPEHERKRIRFIGIKAEGARAQRIDAEIRKAKIKDALNAYFNEHPALKTKKATVIANNLFEFGTFPGGNPYIASKREKFLKVVRTILREIRPIKRRKSS